MTLKDRLYLAIRAARVGREILLQHAGNLKQIEKKHLAGWVSEADKQSEQAIFAFLRSHFPTDEYLGEESAEQKLDLRPSEKGRWVLDPLDGTTNYLHGFPMYAVSLAYEQNGLTQLAVIDMPALGEVYTALRGGGAHLNGQRLQVSATERLEEALMATGFFGEIPERLAEQMTHFTKLVVKTRGIRRAGAAAYDLCLVARGVFDAYWEKGLSPWDTAAGLLMVEEAGGIVTNYKGEAYHPYMDSVVAGNPSVHALVLKEIRNN